MKTLNKMASDVLGRFLLVLAALLALAAFTGNVSAQTDTLTTTIDSISGYWTAAEVIAVGILLFVIGRKVVRKI
jgi:spermidine/putrescine-binding protein